MFIYDDVMTCDAGYDDASDDYAAFRLEYRTLP
jgi:hypothetical protein